MGVSLRVYLSGVSLLVYLSGVCDWGDLVLVGDRRDLLRVYLSGVCDGGIWSISRSSTPAM